VTIGFRAQVNATLELSTVQEAITVTDGSPLVDRARRARRRPSTSKRCRTSRQHATPG
jgi:hypothetical protein